jgi:hypothetical protein
MNENYYRKYKKYKLQYLKLKANNKRGGMKALRRRWTAPQAQREAAAAEQTRREQENARRVQDQERSLQQQKKYAEEKKEEDIEFLIRYNNNWSNQYTEPELKAMTPDGVAKIRRTEQELFDIREKKKEEDDFEKSYKPYKSTTSTRQSEFESTPEQRKASLTSHWA